MLDKFFYISWDPIGFFLSSFHSTPRKPDIVPFEVIQPPPPPLVENVTPPESTAIKRLAPKLQAPVNAAPPKKVFGVSERALRDDTPRSDLPAVVLGAGNTLETTPTKQLENPGPLLPVPVAEYLVSQMPVPTKEIIIPYPPTARDQGLQGPVVMELLVDDQGNVREVTLIKGPAPVLNEAALTAARKLSFKPAKMNDKSVAVRVRYTYTFVLEKS